MTLSQKESTLLSDLKSQEQLCIEKYARYSAEACDGNLKNLFTDIGNIEKSHLDTINSMLNGTFTQMSGGTSQSSSANYIAVSSCTGSQKDSDAYLCADALAGEKHVSALYDTCVFEFSDVNMRDALNHIQKEEQQHGEKIYAYMAKNGMYPCGGQ